VERFFGFFFFLSLLPLLEVSPPFTSGSFFPGNGEEGKVALTGKESKSAITFQMREQTKVYQE
jgi:hypothetical protein